MRTTLNWRWLIETCRVAVPVLSLGLAACHAPSSPAAPPGCTASASTGTAWTAEASRRAITHDVLLAEVVAREGFWRSCRGERRQGGEGQAGFGRLVFVFASGTTLTIDSMPPETSVVSLRQPDGLAPEAAWMDRLKRYAAARGVPVDWSRHTQVTAADGTRSLRFEATDSGWNAHAVVEHSAAGRLVGLTLSVAL